MTKPCSKCGAEKDLTQFPRDKRCIESRAGQCNQCRGHRRKETGRDTREYRRRKKEDPAEYARQREFALDDWLRATL